MAVIIYLTNLYYRKTINLGPSLHEKRIQFKLRVVKAKNYKVK